MRNFSSNKLESHVAKAVFIFIVSLLTKQINAWPDFQNEKPL